MRYFVRIILFWSLVLPSTCFGQKAKFRDDNRKFEKVINYHKNGVVRSKGKRKRYHEHLGCLGKRAVYRKSGRWKYFDEHGQLETIIVFDRDRRVKVIEKQGKK